MFVNLWSIFTVILWFLRSSSQATWYTSRMLKICISFWIFPFRPKTAPYTRANILSKISIWWVSRLVLAGYKKTINECDIWPLPKEELIQDNYSRFKKLWEKEVQTYGSEDASIARVFVIAFRRRLAYTFLLYCLTAALNIGSSVSYKLLYSLSYHLAVQLCKHNISQIITK